MAASRVPHSTKTEAEAAGRERAKQENTEHIVHDADGRSSNAPASANEG
jgi:hypothetical protein